jgi:uncharacterized protein YjeT (DUF2065 family)
MRKLKGNKTRLFGMAVAVLGVVEMYVREVIQVEYQGLVLMGIGVAIVILRELTDTPAGRSE